MNDQRGPDPDGADDDPTVFRFDPSTEPAPFDDVPADDQPRRGLFDDVPDLEPSASSGFGPETGELFGDPAGQAGADGSWSPFAPPTGEQPAVGDVEPAFRFDDVAGEPTGSLPHWTEPSTGVMDVEAIADAGEPMLTDEEARIDAWASLDDPSPVWSDGEREARSPRTTSTNPVLVGGWDEPDAVEVPTHPPADRNLNTAIASGVVLAGGIVALLVLAPTAVIAVLVAALATLAVGEVFTTYRQIGHHPAHVLGLAATAGFVLGAYWQGAAALPVLIMLFVVASFAHFIIEQVERPLTGWSLTVATVMWIAVPASFASLMLRAENGRGAFAVAVIAAVASDVGGYFVGRSVGSSRLNAGISPNKTWEGLFGGAALCVVVLVGLSAFASFEPIDGILDAVVVGIVLSVAVPLGDLGQSLVKRDLGVKDMGNMIPGHGGLTDRFDGLLFSLAATWLVLVLLDLAPAGTTL